MSSSYPDAVVRRLAGTVVAAALALLVRSPSARAATNWNYDPRVEVGGTYDDNFLLGETPQTQVAVGGPFVDALVALHGASPRSDIVITPHVHSTLFPGHSEDQSTDGYLDAVDAIETPRSHTRLQGSYANQTIAAADFLPATFPGVELGQPVVSNSGVVEHLERQQTLNLNPTSTLNLTQRTQLNLGADYYRAWFDSRIPGQVGFQNFEGDVGVGFRQTQRSTLSLRGQYIYFRPEEGLPTARHGGLDGEWDYEESKILRVYVRAGAGVTEGHGAGGSSVTLTDFEGGIGARWTYQVTQMVVDVLRTALPSSFGVLVNQDELRFRLTRTFTPRFAGFIAARGIHLSESQRATTNVPNRSYATGSTGVEWRITRNYSLEASYTHYWQKFAGDPASANSNSVGVSIVYEPHRLDRPADLTTVGSESTY